MATNTNKKSIKPGIESIDPIQALIPVGCGFDLYTGRWVTLEDGSSVILGGLSRYWSISGPPNSYKTAILLYFQSSAADKFAHIAPVPSLTYDTENSYSLSRLQGIINHFPGLRKLNYVYSGDWVIVTKYMALADVWWKETKTWFKNIIKNNKTVTTPFIDPRTKKHFVMKFPAMLPIDSMAEFESTAVAKFSESKDLGDAKAKVYYMNRGFDKARVLGELGTLVYKAGAFSLISCHLGEEHSITTMFPKKKFTNMPPGKILKGVPENFGYLVTHIWLTDTAKELHVEGKIKYPKQQSLKDTPAGDIVSVKCTLVRSKTSISGHVNNIIISQSDGVLPHLTAVVALREEHNRYGMTGDNVRYVMDLYPSIVLMRTTLIENINASSKLRRAIEITREMYQTFYLFLFDDPKLVCTPAELRESLENLGYDWDIILESRGYWVAEEKSHPIPRLSTMDLLNIRIGKYEAKWAMKSKKKKKDK